MFGRQTVLGFFLYQGVFCIREPFVSGTFVLGGFLTGGLSLSCFSPGAFRGGFRPDTLRVPGPLLHEKTDAMVLT